MTSFNEIIVQLPENFEEFFSRVLKLMELDTLSVDQVAPIREEVLRMFTDILVESVSRVLTDEDLDFVAGYSLLHPEVSDIDIYFGVASSKPHIDEMLKNVMDEAFERLTYLKSKFSGV